MQIVAEEGLAEHGCFARDRAELIQSVFRGPGVGYLW